MAQKYRGIAPRWKKLITATVLVGLAFWTWNARGKLIAAEKSNATRPKSVLIFPVNTAPDALPSNFQRRMGLVIATFLEKGGISELTVADQPFTEPRDADLAATAAAFGQHVAASAIQADVALLTKFVGGPKTGIEAIQTIVVDRTGKVTLAESAGPKFPLANTPPRDPMTCCMYVAQRLREPWKLDDPFRANAPEGKMAPFWRQDAGVPTEDELKRLATRLGQFKNRMRQGSLVVHPIQIGKDSDAAASRDLAGPLRELGIPRIVTDEKAVVAAPAGHSNEQKVLWDLARAFQKSIRARPPQEDYALLAAYGKSEDRIHFVHVVICDRAGEWVYVGLQNSHQPEYQKINPRSIADAHRLVVAMLRRELESR